MFCAVIKISICLRSRLRCSLYPLKPFSLPIGAGDDFNLDDIVDKIHAAILPTTLIGSRLGTDSESAKNSDQLFTNLLNLLRFDLPAIVIFQWQVNLILFHAAREDLG